MVKVGFIVEGDSDKIFFESENFRNYLQELSISFIPEVINANGNGNLLPKNISEYSKALISKGATHIFVVTDLDTDKCVTLTKERINPSVNHKCIVVKKDIEAWFLADTNTMRTFFENTDFICENPESIENPFNEIHNRRLEFQCRGISNSKIKLANTLVNIGLSFQSMLKHHNVTSVKYFDSKLKELSNL